MIQIISKIVATILGLIAVAIMTRSLGQAGFGQYTTIITFLSFFGIIADLGLTLVTVQMISRPGVDENKILNNLFTLRLISAILFLGLAPLIIIFFPYEPVVKIGVAITSLAFLATALNQILVGLFQKKLRMDKVSIAEVVSRAILVISIFVAIKLGLGLLGIMAATVLASVVSFLIHFILARPYVRIKLQFNLAVWQDIIRVSWPIALTIIFNLIYLKADILILSLIKTQAEVGIYGAAYKVIDVLITVPFMFAGIILPLLTVSWAQNNRLSFNRLMQKSFDFMVILAIPLVIGAQFTSKNIMVLVAGRDFIASGDILKILIIAGSLIYFGAMFSHAIIAIDKQKKIIGAYIFTSLTALAGYLIFIPKFSYFGAAWVTIYSETVIALAAAYYVWKYTRWLPNLKTALKSILASLIMILPLYFFKEFLSQSYTKFFLILSLSILTYLLCLYILKGITRQDIKNLLNK